MENPVFSTQYKQTNLYFISVGVIIFTLNQAIKNSGIPLYVFYLQHLTVIKQLFISSLKTQKVRPMASPRASVVSLHRSRVSLHGSMMNILMQLRVEPPWLLGKNGPPRLQMSVLRFEGEPPKLQKSLHDYGG
jgi:hypothetical protein